MDKNEALDIASNFLIYLRKSDKSLIEKYSKEEIKCALSLIPSSDGSKPWYKEMEKRVAELDDSGKEGQWHKNYFFDKILPLIVAGLISFAVGYSLKVVEVRNLKEDVRFLEAKEATLQSEIKEAVESGNPSKLTEMFGRLNRLSAMSKEDKHQLRMLQDKEDNLLEQIRLAVAKKDPVSISILERELKQLRQKITRFKE